VGFGFGLFVVPLLLLITDLAIYNTIGLMAQQFSNRAEAQRLDILGRDKFFEICISKQTIFFGAKMGPLRNDGFDIATGYWDGRRAVSNPGEDRR
jgi:hypothetical protein